MVKIKQTKMEKIKKLLGPFPEKCKVRGAVIEEHDCESYIREKVSYYVEENEEVTAYILKPIHKGKYPAVICHHQHQGKDYYGKDEPAGLAGNKELSFAIELAKLGYIAFVPEAIAYGERKNADDPIGYNYWEMATRLVQGKTLLAKNIHDISQGIDYLESRQDIDKARIGFIGHSYGGRIGIWCAAFDKRIKATVCNCGCISYKESLTEDAGIQLEFVIQGIMNQADIEDVVALIEPNNLLISATSEDKWSRGAKRIYEKAKPYFNKGHLKLLQYEGKHEFTKEMRENAYEFLHKYLVP